MAHYYYLSGFGSFPSQLQIESVDVIKLLFGGNLYLPKINKLKKVCCDV